MENSHKQYSTVLCDTQANFRIDPEFQNKIPPMPTEDFNGLKADIIADGYVRDPLVVWKEENTLVDGHHRWQIIQDNYELLKDKYTVVYKTFPDRWAAIAWICANQLHKHNMTEIQRMKLIQEEHDARQHSNGASDGFRGNQYTKVVVGENHQVPEFELEIVRSGKPGKEGTTRPTIAREHGITENEVRTAVEIGRAIDKVENVAPGFKEKILSGEVKANKRDLANMRKMDEEEIAQAVEDIYAGKKPKRNPPKPKTEEEKRDLAEIEAIVRDMRDPTTTPKFTLDFLIEDIELNGQTYVELLDNTLKDREQLVTDENKPRIAAAITKVVENILKVRDSM